jgi:hypothetical protein
VADKKIRWQIASFGNCGLGIRPARLTLFGKQEVAHKSMRDNTQILANAARNGLKASVLGFSIRSGLLFLLRLIKVAKRKETLLTALERSLLGQESFRFAAFFGLFAFLWKGINVTYFQIKMSFLITPKCVSTYIGTNNIIIKLRCGKDDKVNGFIAGFIAGLSILVEEKSRRITLSQQLFVRGLQGLYNSLKVRGIFQFTHGDSLIFA